MRTYNILRRGIILYRAPAFTKEGKIKVETFNVELSKIVNNMKLDKLYYPEHEVMISTADLNRPGLQITGFFD